MNEWRCVDVLVGREMLHKNLASFREMTTCILSCCAHLVGISSYDLYLAVRAYKRNISKSYRNLVAL